MELYTNNIQDRYGNAIVGAQVLVLKEGGSAVIYSDNGVTPAPNPLTTDADGEFRFYAASGKYDLTVTSPRLPEPIYFPGIALFDPEDINAELRDQLASTDPNMGASMVGVQAAGTISSATVQAALEELDSDIQNLTAADIAFAPAGSIAATDVQNAIEELDADVTALAGDALVSADIGVTVQGYDATLLNASDIGVSVQAYDADTAKTDVAQTFTKGQRGGIVALTDGATITPDFNDANFFSVTLGGNRTLANPSNLTAGQSGSIFVTQDGGGSKTLVYDSYWDFEGGSAPTLSTAGGTVDRLDYVVRSTTSIHASLKKAWS